MDQRYILNIINKNLSLSIYSALSNSNLRGLLMGGGMEYKAGLTTNKSTWEVCGRRKWLAYIDVPHIAAGLPMIILSETPAMLSFFPKAEASKR